MCVCVCVCVCVCARASAYVRVGFRSFIDSFNSKADDLGIFQNKHTFQHQFGKLILAHAWYAFFSLMLALDVDGHVYLQVYLQT